MTSPYRDSLSAMVKRREVLVRELELQDAMIRDRAGQVIPCGGGLSWWQRRRLRRAWAAIKRLGRWDETRCAMYHMEPCTMGNKPCGCTEHSERTHWPRFNIGGHQPRGPSVDPADMVPPLGGTGARPPPIRIVEGKVRKGGVNRQRPRGERPPPPAPGRVQLRDGKGDLVCGFPTTEPTLFGDPVFSQPQPPKKES